MDRVNVFELYALSFAILVCGVALQIAVTGMIMMQ